LTGHQVNQLAMLHAARARALGKLGLPQETLAAVGEADKACARAHPTEDHICDIRRKHQP
jgi:hypothetical protein